MTDTELINAAITIRDNAYAKYSSFFVGAALYDENDQLYLGCNVENAAYPLGSCAEAGAIAAMVAGGGSRIRKIAIAGGGDALTACTPCGGCRQRIHEFADDDTEIIVRNADGDWVSYPIEELLPASFTLP